MEKKYLIDVGSSTVKIYETLGELINIVSSRTFNFKKDFSPKDGLSCENKALLFSYFREVCTSYGLTKTNVKLFATGIFRDIENPKEFIGDFYEATGLYFNIISHDLEAFYLEKAWLGKCDNLGRSLVINIGGNTTELLACEGSVVKKRELLHIGVGSILEKYPLINETYSAYALSTIVNDISKLLPAIEGQFPVAIYTGGELNYMKIAGYPLRKNSLFYDEKHPLCIESELYYNYNEKIFSDISLEHLKSLMPYNPNWMNGARACSAIAQAICSRYSVDNIIPSDSNLIDGVVHQEARTVVLCGSFNKHLMKIAKLIDLLNEKGISVLSPKNTTVAGCMDGFVLFDGDLVVNNCKWSIERKHIEAIKRCDMVIVCNYDNYIGTSTVYEWARADSFGKKVVFLEDNDVAQNMDFPFEIGLLE